MSICDKVIGFTPLHKATITHIGSACLLTAFEDYTLAAPILPPCSIAQTLSVSVALIGPDFLFPQLSSYF